MCVGVGGNKRRPSGFLCLWSQLLWHSLLCLYPRVWTGSAFLRSQWTLEASMFLKWVATKYQCYPLSEMYPMHISCLITSHFIWRILRLVLWAAVTTQCMQQGQDSLPSVQLQLGLSRGMGYLCHDFHSNKQAWHTMSDWFDFRRINQMLSIALCPVWENRCGPQSLSNNLSSSGREDLPAWLWKDKSTHCPPQFKRTTGPLSITYTAWPG